MTYCIWCQQPSKTKAKEHIIPEALGCPDGFWLTNGEVCKSCNNRLAHLDQAVVDDFDILLFMNRIPRKKNRLPEVSNRGNILTKSNKNEPIFFINMAPRPIVIEGNYIGPYGKSKRNINATFEVRKSHACMSFSSTIGENPKFARGIVKIALSSLAYFINPNEILQPKYNQIRDFVIRNEADRKIFLGKTDDLKYKNQVWSPYKDKDGNFHIIMRLGVVEFIVDLSPDMTMIPILYDNAMKLYGEKGWTILPISN